MFEEETLSFEILLKDYKNLLKNLKCNFEGLKKETKHCLTNLLKCLGAQITEDAQYIFTDIYFFKSDDTNQKKKRKDLYSIIFFLDCLKENKFINISMYRFYDYFHVQNKLEVKKKNYESNFETDFYGFLKTNCTGYNAEKDKILKEYEILMFQNKKKKNDVVVENKNSKKSWWLITDVPDSEACKVTNCTMEPGRHKKHSIPARNFTIEEQRIMLKYIIKTESMPLTGGKKLWEVMMDSGYLTHRTEESLRNNFRRCILPNLHMFNLPEEIVQMFNI